MDQQHNEHSAPIVIIGAGPGGLATAKALLDEGLEVLVLEASEGIGGQWNSEAAHSGVWSGMPTNTSKATTVFSDLDHDPDTPMFPAASQIGAYLQRYAETFGLATHIELGARVSKIERRSGGGFRVAYRDASGEHQQDAARVVIASGRCTKPKMPEQIEGLDGFTGKGGVLPAFDYTGPEAFSGQRVLTIGNSVSGLEIASHLATVGVDVVSSCRKPRYIIQKFTEGVASDWRFFNRAAVSIGRTLPPEQASAGMRDQVLALHGNPGDQGAPRPSENMMEAGLAQCQHYLELTAAGKIQTRGAPIRVDGREVTFQAEDGDTCVEAFDAIICATGYELDLPYLSAALCEELSVGTDDLDLFNYTFSPAVEGLAFVGQFMLIGPYFPVLELQARWIAMVFAGHRALPSPAEMAEGVRHYRFMRGLGAPILFHDAAVDIASMAGVEPSLQEFSEIAAGLVFGPIVPAQFRLSGHGSREDGVARLRASLAGAGLELSPPPAPEQLGLLKMLAGVPSEWPGAREAWAVLGAD